MKSWDEIWDLTEKWNDEYKDLARKITKRKKFKRLYISPHEFIKFADEYLEIFQKKLATKELNSLNDLFEQMQDEIPDITNDNFLITDDHLEFRLYEKMEYLVENHSEYFFEKLEPQKTNFHDISKAAEYYIMDDFLYEFHDEFKKEFSKELKLEQQNQMSM
ncbi:hypothetical protein C4M97_00460 [Mycoplasmopsis pullorum]|nr:hypothetical protein C4M94_03800 [Mycoplasmopsis pullorum]TNK82448.1 hypothetical protein C4M80_02980 [Mycoplasmopsis pullorum]TNK84075.1 hypothetical protein C4M81_03390 [Mycoplasmopsis pullorum]TNK84393.1 hypothetical protein C4M85_03955 [Mycoplasmopsis pullorum]TNK84589.1 hypothetical protein C4M92_03190 [Mycoplasmopsis pullorum]